MTSRWFKIRFSEDSGTVCIDGKSLEYSRKDLVFRKNTVSLQIVYEK
jgi:hypothetical protein